MKVPYLITWDRTPVTVTITDAIGGMDENGAPKVAATYLGKCNFTSKAKTIRNKDGQLVNLGGVLTIKGDIAPAIPSITGYATLDGNPRNIHSSEKVRNPDGSVNHTRLELL